LIDQKPNMGNRNSQFAECDKLTAPDL